MSAFDPALTLAWLFNDSPVKDQVVVNDRWGSECRHKHGGYYTTEYAAGLQDASHPWEESWGMAYSYGYNRAERIDDYERELLVLNGQLALMMTGTIRRVHPSFMAGPSSGLIKSTFPCPISYPAANMQ